MKEEEKSLREIIQDHYTDLKSNIVELTKEILSIKTALKGDEFGQTGLVNKVISQEKRIGKLEKQSWKLAGGLAVIVIFVQVVLTLIIKYA